MILLDYTYYQLTNLYRYFNKDGAERSYGVIMTCGLPCWNLIFILMIIDNFYIDNTLPSSKYLALLYCLPIAFLVALRYWKYTSYDEIKEKIQNYNKTTRIIADIILIIYVLSSLFGMIGFAGYVGITKHR